MYFSSLVQARLLNINSNQPHQTDSLYHLTDALKNSLEAVDELIIESLSGGERLIQEIAKTLINSGGKRLRPLLCLASSAIVKEVNNNSLYLAAAVELIHAATLLHDDVIDESTLRRGSPTANTTWGNKPSILVGDFLFASAFEMMVKTGNIECLDILSSASTKISEGEITQLRTMHSLNVSVDGYINLIEKKTAILFESACRTGAIAANADKTSANSLAMYGRYFGIMYQIMDDVHDYTNNTRGKVIGDDFKEGKVTLPVLLAFKEDSDKDFWIDTFASSNQNQNSWEVVQQKFAKFDIVEKSYNMAKVYKQKAKEQLGFSNHPYAELLTDLLDQFG